MDTKEINSLVLHEQRLATFAVKARHVKYSLEGKPALKLEQIPMDTKVSLYIEYFNNYLTIEFFARSYYIPDNLAESILNESREFLAIKDITK